MNWFTIAQDNKHILQIINWSQGWWEAVATLQTFVYVPPFKFTSLLCTWEHSSPCAEHSDWVTRNWLCERTSWSPEPGSLILGSDHPFHAWIQSQLCKIWCLWFISGTFGFWWGWKYSSKKGSGDEYEKWNKYTCNQTSLATLSLV